MAAVTLDTTPARSQNGKILLRLTACTPGAIGAATDLLTAPLTPAFLVSMLRITVCMQTASTFVARFTPFGGAAVTVIANQAVALPASAGFVFLLPASGTATYNFRSTLANTIDLLQIEEIEGQ